MQEKRLGLLGLARFSQPTRNVHKERDCGTPWLEVATDKFTFVFAFGPTSVFQSRVGIGNVKGLREEWASLLGLSQFDKLTRNVHEGTSFSISVLDGVESMGQVKRLGEDRPGLFGLPRFDKHPCTGHHGINSLILRNLNSLGIQFISFFVRVA